jgi:DNA-binding beta-propeller fold protein YncE
VADYSNDAIRRIDSSGVTTVVTSAGGPTAVAIGPDGTIYYVATWNGSIVSVTKDGTSTTLANINSYGDQIGPGATAQLRPVDGLVFTPQGLVVSDTGNNRMRFVAFDPQNTVSNLLGNGQAGAGVGDGIDSQVVLPRGVAAFNGGYVVADSMNHRILWFSAAAS